VIYAIDADILIGALDSTDRHHGAARRAFTSWRAARDTISMSVINLSEVLVAPAADPHRLRTARAAIAALGVEVHRPVEAIGVAAARFRARHPISLPDAYLLATAKQIDATVASFDRRVLRAAEAESLRTASRF
jgi:predicted nucleic acid-binding protein